MVYGGVVIALLGVVLWLTALPSLGYALIIIGAIVAVLGLFLDHRGSRQL